MRGRGSIARCAVIGVTGQPIAAAYYVMFGAAVGLLATLALGTSQGVTDDGLVPEGPQTA